MDNVKIRVWETPEGWYFEVIVVNPGGYSLEPGDIWSSDGPYGEEIEARVNAENAALEFPG